jgi:hypothetical protein
VLVGSLSLLSRWFGCMVLLCFSPLLQRFSVPLYSLVLLSNLWSSVVAVTVGGLERGF